MTKPLLLQIVDSFKNQRKAAAWRCRTMHHLNSSPMKTALLSLLFASMCACAVAGTQATPQGEITSAEREFAKEYMK
jgi:hypothetical protein